MKKLKIKLVFNMHCLEVRLGYHRTCWCLFRKGDSGDFHLILRVGQRLSELCDGKAQAAVGKSDSFLSLIQTGGQSNGIQKMILKLFYLKAFEKSLIKCFHKIFNK